MSAATILFVAFFFALFYLVLPACGVVGPSFLKAWSFCKSSYADDDTALLQVDEQRVALERRILTLQQDLALRQCTAELPDVDAELWDGQDITVLDGCWNLDFEYRVTDVETDEEAVFDDWTLCFEGETGVGTQVMQSTTGVICQSDIPGAFNDQNQLVLEETDNLSCSNDSYIFRRQITCDRTEDGRLSCQSVQPERSGSGEGGAQRFQMSRQ